MFQPVPENGKRSNTDWHLRVRYDYFKKKIKENLDSGEMLVYRPVSLADRMAYTAAFDDSLDDIKAGMRGKRSSGSEKKILDLTKNGRIVSQAEFQAEGVPRSVINRLVADGFIAHAFTNRNLGVFLKSYVQGKRYSTFNEDFPKESSKEWEKMESFTRGACSEFSDITDDYIYKDHYALFDRVSKAPVRLFEPDHREGGLYSYAMFLLEDQRFVSFHRGSVMKEELQPHFDNGMLELRNGKLFMTDVGKRVHAYGKYCTIVKEGIFRDKPPEVFLRSVNSIDSIPEHYAGKTRKELVGAIRDMPDVHDAVMLNEIMDGLVFLPEKKFSEIEKGVKFDLKINRLYNEERYQKNRAFCIEQAGECIDKMKAESAKNADDAWRDFQRVRFELEEQPENENAKKTARRKEEYLGDCNKELAEYEAMLSNLKA